MTKGGGTNMEDIAHWVERVGDPIYRRRIELGYGSMRAAAQAAGVSDTAWRGIERGRHATGDGEYRLVPPPSDRTKIAIADLLLWPHDAFDRLLLGEHPDDLTQAMADGAGRHTPGVVSQSLLARLAHATPEQLALIEQLLDGAASGWDDLAHRVALHLMEEIGDGLPNSEASS